MHTVDLKSWADFSDAIAKVRADYGRHTIELPDGTSHALENAILFRGQSNAVWQLETTLERTTAERYSVPQYLERADFVVNEIESVTGRRWQLPSFPEIKKEIETVQDSCRAHLPCYEYLVYLRHHGFPSPLLDWTRSPYVAAYFALEQSNDADRCAVFAYVERPDGGKMLCGGEPTIRSMGPHITTDRRHFAQKASYTIATQWDDTASKHFFCSHHAIAPPIVGEQDVLVRITIPRADRKPALRHLEDYNINHYTLFQTEDSLVRSLGLRALELDGT